jgi:plastocyanin
MLNSRYTKVAVLGAVTVLLGGCTMFTSSNTAVNTNTDDSMMEDKKDDEAMIEDTANTNSNDSMKEDKKDDGAMVNVNVNAGVNAGDGMMKGETKSFTVEAANFGYSVKEIKVKKGDTVKIKFVNKEGFHDWVLDEFNAKTPQIMGGKTADIEFVATKTGTFEYYCSVGQHRAMGMVGKLIVE